MAHHPIHVTHNLSFKLSKSFGSSTSAEEASIRIWLSPLWSSPVEWARETMVRDVSARPRISIGQQLHAMIVQGTLASLKSWKKVLVKLLMTSALTGSQMGNGSCCGYFFFVNHQSVKFVFQHSTPHLIIPNLMQKRRTQWTSNWHLQKALWPMLNFVVKSSDPIQKCFGPIKNTTDSIKGMIFLSWNIVKKTYVFFKNTIINYGYITANYGYITGPLRVWKLRVYYARKTYVFSPL